MNVDHKNTLLPFSSITKITFLDASFLLLPPLSLFSTVSESFLHFQRFYGFNSFNYLHQSQQERLLKLLPPLFFFFLCPTIHISHQDLSQAMDQLLMINYSGEWNGSVYVGGDSCIAVANKNATFAELVDLIYTVTEIDRIKFDIQIHYLVRASENSAAVRKFRVKSDHNLRFVMLDKVEHKDIYIDAIMRDVGVSIPTAVSAPAQAQLRITDDQNQFASASGSNQASNPVAALQFPEYPNQETNNEDLSSNEEETSNTDEEEDVDNVDETNNRGGLEVPEVIPEVIFSGFQFEPNHLQEHWIVPGAEDCEFMPTRTEESNVFRRDVFYRGAIFRSKEAMKMVLGKCGLVERYDYRIRRSCSVRFEAGCKSMNCKFEIRARRPSGCSMWHVVKYEPEHDCVQDLYESHFRSVKAIVIGKLYASKVVHNTYNPSHVMGEMVEQYDVQVLYTKAWRALQYANRLTYGKADESYQQLPSYLHMLKETNPGSVTAIKTDSHNRFLYSFFALAGSLHGFRSGYIRPVIALDATHLKGEYKGVIFVAACKDGEEMIYPIAFGFGDGEKDNAWTWFLSRLREAIGVPPEDMVIVSDRHTSIGSAMRAVFPSVPHVFCFVHLRENLKKHCKQRKDVFTAFYDAAYAHSRARCDEYLAEIGRMHPGTHERLLEVGVERWSRAYCPRRRYFMMTTNIAESLNQCMMKARRLPITTAHEFLRHMLQKWFCSRRAAAEKLTSDVTGAADTHIRVAHEDSLDGGCQVFPIVQMNKYLVTHTKKGDGIVELLERSCSCGGWDLDRLPCVHAIATARHIRVHYHTFCHQYFSTEWVRAAYAPEINPLPNPQDWVVPPEIHIMVVLPPEGRRQPGRPKEARIRSAGEAPRRKKCKNCGRHGHNRLGCPDRPTSSSIGEASSSATLGVRAVRKCRLCHQPGHTRRRCPLRFPPEEQDNDENQHDNEVAGNDNENVSNNDGNDS